MAIFYHLVKRKVLAGEEAGSEKYFAQVRTGVVVGLDQLCDQVTELATNSRGDVKVVIDKMVTAMCDYLTAGYITQMGDLGNFRLSAGSKGVKDAEDFKLHMMRNPRILFSPGRLLRRMLSKVTYSRINPIERIKYVAISE